jgi:hypothetical protein
MGVAMRGLFAVLIATLVTSGCGSDAAAPTPSPAAIPSSAAAATLVGEWERVTTCAERAAGLRRVGLGRFAAEHAASEGWLPGVTTVSQVKDREHPCDGAVPLKHVHFFTAAGSFGSRDAQGNQVDDGTYRVVDDSLTITKEFGDVTFRFEIRANGDLYLTPVLPACVKDGCFAAQWAVAVAYQGLPWSRVS